MKANDKPRTEAGQALLKWAETAHAGQDQLRIWIWREHIRAIEAEAGKEHLQRYVDQVLAAEADARAATSPIKAEREAFQILERTVNRFLGMAENSRKREDRLLELSIAADYARRILSEGTDR